MLARILHALASLGHTLANFGPLGLLALAFVDSAGIPVASGMDALLLLIAVETPRRVWWCAALAIAGSLAGTLVLFWTARQGGRLFLERSRVAGREHRFRAWFERYGLVTIFVPALSPVPMPLKLFVASAGALGTPVWSFVTVLLLARALHYFGIAWLGVMLGKSSGYYLKSHTWQFLLILFALFLLLYAVVAIRAAREARKIRQPAPDALN